MYYSAWKFPGIYLIVHRDSGKLYVGQSVNIAKRIAVHMSPSATGCVHLANAIKLYGKDAFEVLVAERVDDLEKLTEREQYWLDTLHSYDPRRGFNVLPVADSRRGHKLSEETKARLSAANIGHTPSAEARAKMSEARKGKPRSEETKMKMRIAGMGRKMSDETRAKQIGRKHTEAAKAKMRAASTGKPAWNKDLKTGPMSEESREKMRNRSDEWRAKQREAHLGLKRSAEVVAKTALANTGRKHTDQARANMSAGRMGFKAGPMPEATKAKISAAQKGRPAWNKGVPATEETRSKITAANTGRKHSEETKAKMRQSALEREARKRAAKLADADELGT